jgi:hypothetical protein
MTAVNQSVPQPKRRGKAPTERQRQTAKQRLYRQRQAMGVAVYPVPLGHDQIEKMITIGLLGENESAVTGEVVKAIIDLINDYLKARGV